MRIYPPRQVSNIEMLRIVCMVMIILFHYYLYGAFSKEMDVTASHVVMQLLSSGSKIGVDVFVVITGYFLGIADKMKSVRLA